MNLILNRKYFNEECTIGQLSVDGEYFCYTLEDVVRPTGLKVHGETAIPEGEYEVTITVSPKFKREMPLLLGVEGFEGVRIHTGNSAADTHGCILVGKEKYSDTRIGNCAVIYNELFSKIKEAIKQGEEVTLEIINQ